MRWGVAVLALAACGRVGFDGVPGADGATDSATLSCFRPGVTIVCDDFEAPTLDHWPVVDNMTRVSSPVRTGSGAVRASINLPTEQAGLVISPAGLAASPRLVLRLWIYVTGTSSLTQANFATFGDQQSPQELTVLGYADEVRIWRYTSSVVGYSGALLPRDQWVCIELDVAIDDTAGTLQLAMDGTVQITDGPIDTNGEYDNFYFGLPYSNFTNQGAATVYYDDVHLGTAPVGCQ